MINRVARVPMTLRIFSGTEHLNATTESLRGGTTSHRIGVIEHHGIVRIALPRRGKSFERVKDPRLPKRRSTEARPFFSCSSRPVW